MPVIMEMERRGVCLDGEQLETDLKFYQRKLVELDNTITTLVGQPVAVDSKAPLLKALIDSGKVDTSKLSTTAKTGAYSAAKDSLFAAVTDPQLLGPLLVRGALATCIRTFMEPWHEAASHHGKLFIRWNQIRNYTDTGARTGRFSSTPNLQNVPTNWEILTSRLERIGFELGWDMPKLRKYIVPRPGYIFIGRDYCLHPDTEFLTEHGWQTFDQVQEGTALAQWESGLITYAQPYRRIEQAFEGELLHAVGAKSFDVLATPDHRMVVLPRSGKLEMELVPLKDAPIGVKNYKQIPQAGESTEVHEMSEAMMAFVAAFQADGTQVSSSQLRFKLSKAHKIERLRWALTVLGVPYEERVYQYEYDTGAFTWFFLAPPTWLANYVEFPEKNFTRLVARAPRSFLDEVTKWDGSQGTQYYSTNRHNVDIIQELACTRGRHSTITVRPGTNKPVYVLSLHQGATSYTKTQVVSSVPYSGRVVCFEMPAHTLVIRRNGKPCVVGNCAQEMRLLAHFAGGALLDALIADPTKDVHMIAAEIAGITRKQAKTLAFAILYGAGVGRIAESLGITVAEATAIKARYLKALPEIKRFSAELSQAARMGQPISTLAGRQYYVESPKVIDGRLRTFEYKLTNYKIQGSAADQCKEAMYLYSKNTKSGELVLTVHDQLVAQVPIGEEEREMAVLEGAMNGAFQDVLQYKIISDSATAMTFGDLK